MSEPILTPELVQHFARAVGWRVTTEGAWVNGRNSFGCGALVNGAPPRSIIAALLGIDVPELNARLGMFAAASRVLDGVVSPGRRSFAVIGALIDAAEDLLRRAGVDSIEGWEIAREAALAEAP